MYPEEWKNFWNRRYKELQTENKDPSQHDFKPEWIVFWIQRMKQLHNYDVDMKKKEIRLVLGLPLEDKEHADSPASGGNTEDRRKRRSSPSERSDSRKVVRSSRSTSRRRSRSRSRSPSYAKKSVTSYGREERDRSLSMDRERIRERERLREKDRERNLRFVEGGPTNRDSYYKEPEDYYYFKSRPQFHDYPSQTEQGNAEEDDDEPLTIVSMLRLLTALEEQMGSLGPKVLDLMAKALALEKAKANSSDDILLNDENSVLFETIKEKLKGQLIAGVIERHKMNAVKKAIKNIAALVHQVNHKKLDKKNEKQSTCIITVAMDNQVIAQKIAAALIAEKKTDVTPKQLEILINVFLEMLKKSKELNKVVTTNDYIEMKETEKVEIVAKTVDIMGLNKKDKEKTPEKEPEKEEKSDEESVQEFSDSDLRALLQNFKYLSSDEQQHLLNYVKRLETENPERVEKLKKMIDLNDVMGRGEKKLSPQDMNPTKPEQPEEKIRFEIRKRDETVPLNRRPLDYDDDEDYSFDDVIKMANKNVSKSSDVQPDERSRSSASKDSPPSKFNYDDTQNLIANIMGSLQKNVKKTVIAPAGQAGGSSSAAKSETVHAGPKSESNSISTNLPYYQQQSGDYDGTPYNQTAPMNQDYDIYNQQQNYQMYQQQQQQYPPQDQMYWNQQQQPQQQQQQYYDYGNYNNQYIQQPNNGWGPGPYQ